MPEPPPTPWQRISRQRKSVNSEKLAANLEGGRRVAGSGNKREKGDVRNETWRIEDKYTDDASFRITLEDWEKICRHALMTPPGLLPQMRITIQNHTLRVVREEDWLWLCAKAEAPIFDKESPLPGEPYEPDSD